MENSTETKNFLNPFGLLDGEVNIKVEHLASCIIFLATEPKNCLNIFSFSNAPEIKRSTFFSVDFLIIESVISPLTQSIETNEVFNPIDEISILKELAEIKRKANNLWGV